MRRAQVVTAVLAVAAGAAVATSACNALVGLNEPVEIEAGAAAEANLGSDDGEAGVVPPDLGPPAGCTQDQALCPGGCAALEQDSHNCGSCAHDCLAAPCVDGLCEAALLQTLYPVRGVVAIDTEVFAMMDEQVLIVSAAAPGPPSAGSSVVAPLPGTLRSIVGTSGGGLVAAISPGDAVTSLLPPFIGPLFDPDAGDPVSLAASGAHVYYVSSAPSASAVMVDERQIYARLLPGDDACSLAANQAGVYWASTRGTFFQAAGGEPLPITAYASDRAIAASPGDAVVAENGGNFDLLHVASGAAPVVLVPGAYANAVATDGSRVFYAAEGIFEVPLVGGAPTLVAAASVPDECHVPQLTVAGDYVFWVDRATSQLMFVAK